MNHLTEIEQYDTSTELHPLPELLEQAKTELIAKPKATKSKSKQVEAENPQLINELLAQRSHISEQIKALTNQKAEIDNVFKDIIGKADELTVHGAVVVAIARWRETTVNTKYVKEAFALADYPELFKRVDKSRIDIK